MENILFFTNNKNKVKEINKILKRYDINVLSKNEFLELKEPAETGKTFAENARIKSEYGFNKFGVKCIADDSGICIEALKNKPGVYSKRFLNSFKDKYHCFDYIIENVKKTGNYKAYFKTSISLTQKNNHHIIFEGRVDGLISREVKGREGFGYDPIFIPNGHLKTFGEMNYKKKLSIDHRSIAYKKLFKKIKVYF